MDYRKVCKVSIKEFVKIVMNVTEDAIQELESYTPIFEKNGIKGYQEMINDYKRLLEKLRASLRKQ